MLEKAIEFYENDNFKEAYDIFYDLSLDKDKEAMYYMGMMYLNGQGVEADQEKAMAYWKKAQRAGHIDAAYALGEISASTKNIR
ncbi:MAG: hypothetical protein GQ570_02240 [Helicobacteraceae bacterium]|nr:hypothetical protein [Helicobacteraceae bacterium]